MSSLPKRPKRPHITEGHRAMTVVIALSLAAVGTAIYLSPTSAQSAAGAATAVQSTPTPTATSVPDGSVAVPDHPTPSHSRSTAPRPVIQKYYITKRVSNYVPVYHPVPATTHTAVKYVKVKVKVNGKSAAVRRGARLRSTVNLTQLPKGSFRVDIVLNLADGRTVKGTRSYRTCTAKRRGSHKHKA